MPSTKTPSRGPRERARKKRAANQLRKIDFHQARIQELETALSTIQEIVDNDGSFGMDQIEAIIKQTLRGQ